MPYLREVWFGSDMTADVAADASVSDELLDVAESNVTPADLEKANTG